MEARSLDHGFLCAGECSCQYDIPATSMQPHQSKLGLFNSEDSLLGTGKSPVCDLWDFMQV
jgi:hypothetical protein